MSCVCLPYEDGPQVAVVRMRRAKREHRCCECMGTIGVGERYEHTRGLWDGPPWITYKVCDPCREIRDAFFRCGFFYSELWGEMAEYLEDVALADFEALTPHAREKLAAHWAALDAREREEA